MEVATKDGFDVIGQQAAPRVQVTSDLATQRQNALLAYEQRRAQADHDLALLGGAVPIRRCCWPRC